MGTSKKATLKTRKVRVTTNALQNIDEIIQYIAFVNFQPLNAAKVGDAIYATLTRIEQNPQAFKECEQIPTKTKIYRRATCLSWLIIYKITDSEVVILSVIHGARNPSRIKGLRRIK